MLRSAIRPGAAQARVCRRSSSLPAFGAAPFRRQGSVPCMPRPQLPRAAAAAAGAAAPPAADADAASLSTLVDAQMTWPARTHEAGTLRESDAGKEVTVCGWVDRNRNMGGLCFLDVRDHTGLLQVWRAPAWPAWGAHMPAWSPLEPFARGRPCASMRPASSSPMWGPPEMRKRAVHLAAGRGRAPDAPRGQPRRRAPAARVRCGHHGHAARAQGPKPKAADGRRRAAGDERQVRAESAGRRGLLEHTRHPKGEEHVRAASHAPHTR